MLHSVVRNDLDFINETSLHLMAAGGKRFRPLFTLLAGQFGDPEHENVTKSAVVVELIHLATLYHDDVMDEATMRRGAVSANNRWTNSVAILTGDYLFSHASRLVADLGTDAARMIAETFGELVTGQLRETVGPVDGENPVNHYLSVIWQKTGSLIAIAGRFGGLFSGAPAEQVAALYEYGAVIGTAFQISDDIIDITSESADSGKTPGTDLREGVHTLPALYELAGDPKPRLAELLSGPITDEDQVQEALVMLRECEGMRQAKATLESYAERAANTLDALPDGSAKRALNALTRYVIDRTN
ncbi:polyprenyl synthetase family protein [Pseudonocardiaceae bacterium YIM PH 21723]|nr:polyprenyl synthetase family protein [Pseudonocardiaceae bacterium YIM PH 21723]